MKQFTMFLLVAFCLTVDWVDSSQQIVKDMSINFSKALGACKAEMQLPDSIDQDFNNFWRDDYSLSDRFTGCAIICLSTKLNLIDPEGQLHHGNAHDFVKSHGADDVVAKQLVDLWHGCMGTVTPQEDKCAMVLDIAKCFKAGIHKLNWAPDMDAILAEALAEV